jgi:hypothetical protein
LQRKRYRELLEKREVAALKIQQKWKGAKWKRLIPKILLNNKNERAVVIQKWIRGYLERKNAYKKLSKVYQNKMEEYFSDKRQEWVI